MALTPATSLLDDGYPPSLSRAEGPMSIPLSAAIFSRGLLSTQWDAQSLAPHLCHHPLLTVEVVREDKKLNIKGAAASVLTGQPRYSST